MTWRHPALLLAIVLAACGVPDGSLEPVDVDAERFEASVYPILLRDCGFPACHGAPERFFRVLGPGRSRLLASTHPYDPPTADEVRHSFERTRSMLHDGRDVESSLLLRKPLSLSAGGAGHQGDDGWNQSVYASKNNPAYKVLRDWAAAAVEAEP
jgi:hypothetical protein